MSFLVVSLFEEEDFAEQVTVKTIEVLKVLFLLRGWTDEGLDEILEEVRRNNFKTVLTYKKKRWTKNRAFAGEILIEYHEDHADFIFKAHDKKKNSVCELSIIKARSNPFLFKRFLTNSYWEGEKYIIEDELEEIRFVIDVATNSMEIEYTPKENTEEQLAGYLEALHYQTDDKRSDYLFNQ